MEFFFGAFTDEWERRKAALLHDMSLGGSRAGEDESRRRAGGGGGLSLVGAGSGRAGARWVGGAGRKGREARPMRARFTGIARGSQPAVVKMASYGGGVRLGAMLNYVSRAGDVEVEDDRGERIQGRERLSSLRGEWEHLFQNREESRDIGVFAVAIDAVPHRAGDELQALVRETLSRGFGERRFAYAFTRTDDGALTVSGVVVLRGADGERLTGDAKAAEIIQERYDTRSSVEDPSAAFSFAGYGNGVDYGTARLRRLVAAFEGDVHDERSTRIENDSLAGDLVQKDWRHELHSRKSRDVMHLIMSARAGTDVEAFSEAARDFLAAQFAGHRYVFALHDPTQDPKDEADGGKRPHVHVHAIITMKSEFGERIETSPQVFRAWRSLMAEKAREHGIQMEMTDRRELATAPAFGRNQVRPVNHQGRTEHVGTSDAAHDRYQAKRSEQPTTARAARSVDYTIKARETWDELARTSSDRDVAGFASAQEKRIETAVARDSAGSDLEAAEGNFGSKYRANMVWLEAIVSEAENLREMSRPEFEAYEKRVETALFKFERLIGEEDRTDYDEVAAAARDHVNVRREILELTEEQRQLEKDDRVQAADASREGMSGETDRDDARRLSTESERDDANARWDAAVARHGEDVVERANDLLIEIEAARERIDRAQDEGRSTEAAEVNYVQALNTAAELATAGNSYMREVAERDEDLRRAVSEAERAGGGKGAATSADAGVDERNRDATGAEHRSDIVDEQADHDIAAHANPEARRASRSDRERDTSPRSGDASRTDPAQQHVPRLEELEREAREQKDRDRDDFER
ncbi:MAG: conjugal transfer protein TraA [Rhizobiaceae bacterium]